MATELGVAYIQIVGSTKQLRKDIESALSGAEGDAKTSGKKMADAMSDAIGSSLRGTGTDAGRKFSNEFAQQSSGAARTTARAIAGLESDADRAGRQSGKAFGDSFSRSAKSNLDVKGVGEDAGQEAGSGFTAGMSGGLAGLATKGGPIAAALTAVGVLGGKSIAAGMQQELSRDLVQARLGVDPASMGNIASAAGTAFVQNFGDSIAGNMDTAAAAFQAGLIDATTDSGATAKIIGQLDTVSKVLGDDIPSVARSAAQAIRTGMAKDSTEAFDQLVKGAQNGLNVSGDLLDTVNEYSTQFRALGLDGGEALALISQGMKGGARDTDVVADALKEFAIRAVDGSKLTSEAFTTLGLDADATAAKFAQGGQTAHDAFGDVLNRIREMKDPLEQERTSVALFGTQAEDLAGAFNRFDLSKAVQEFGRVAEASQNAANTMASNSTNEWETAKRTIIGKISEMQFALADFASFIPRAFNDGLDVNNWRPPGPIDNAAPGVPLKPTDILNPPSGATATPRTAGDLLLGGIGASVAQNGGLLSQGAVGNAARSPLDMIPGMGGAPGASGLTAAVTGRPTGAMVDSIAAQFGLTKTSGSRPGDDGYHGSGQAGDYGGSVSNMQAFAAYMSKNYGSSLAEIIFDAKGWAGNVKNGKNTGAFGNVYTMDQAGYHGDHVHIAWAGFDTGGWLESGTTMVQNNTGQRELILNPEQIKWLQEQGIDPNMILSGQAAPPPNMPQGQQQGQPATGRTEGYIPAAAGFTGSTGGGVAGSLLNVASEGIQGAIDMAAQGASMGAGAMAPGSAMAIQMGAQAAKRGVQYGFEMAGIGIGALSEIFMPFGTPRWLTDVDPMSFVPRQGGPAGTTTAEQAVLDQQVDPNTTQHGQANGAAPGPGGFNPVPGIESALPMEQIQPDIRGGDTINIYPKDVDESYRLMRQREKLNMMQYGNRP